MVSESDRQLLEEARRNGVTDYEIQLINEMEQQNNRLRLKNLILQKKNDALDQRVRQLEASQVNTPAENHANSEQENTTINAGDGQEGLLQNGPREPEFAMTAPAQLVGQVRKEGQHQNIRVQRDSPATSPMQTGDRHDLDQINFQHPNTLNRSQFEDDNRVEVDADSRAKQTTARRRKRDSCPVCGKFYSYRKCMRRHMQHQHMIIMNSVTNNS